MTDRRRINGPPGGTTPPVFASTLLNSDALQAKRPTRTRRPDEVRKIFLKTGITPSAPGSAYLELSPSSQTSAPPTTTLPPPTSTLKLACTVHGPKPLPRSAPFSPHLVLSTHIKFAPFATRRRRGYVRDNAERDLGVHLETALRGVVIGERWPKSGVDVVVTVLEGEEDGWWGDEGAVGGAAGVVGVGTGWGLMSVLAGCVTVASAAIADAGVDCVDLVAGGVAAVARSGDATGKTGRGVGGEKGPGDEVVVVLDPSPPEHRDIVAACVVGYLSSRDEITELWVKGDAGERAEVLVEQAVQAAMLTRTVLVEAVTEVAALKFPETAGGINGRIKNTGANDTVMVE